MPDRHAASRLVHPVQFRLSGRDYGRLANEAEVSRLRVNELARQIVCGRTQQRGGMHALDPAIVLQLQEIGLRLRRLLLAIGEEPELRARVGEVCRRIERLVDLVVSSEVRLWCQ